jgi:hypothetical protein
LKTLLKLNIASRDQQREKTTRIKQKRLTNLLNTPLKKESRQIKRAKSPEPAIATHLG